MKMSLSTQILLGVLLGVAVGLFVGEYADIFSIVGDAFVGLLQMTVLPYIAIAIILNIGRLSPIDGKRFGAYAITFLMSSAAVTLTAIILLPLCLPARETASFFSTSTLASPTEINFLELFIPSNPFFSLANNIVPAVVLFCIASGVAIMTLEKKGAVLEQLDFLTTALARINRYFVRLAPIGVFAIVANLAGTMRPEEFTSLRAYLILNVVASVVLGFGVFMPLLAALTPFSYRDLLKAARAPVITAFVTGKVFIVLPMLVDAAEELFSKHATDPGEPVSHVRCVTPLVYPFPHAGKLLALLFIPFASWFVDVPMSVSDFPVLLGAGVFSLFGSPVVAMPFLLDMFRLPADLFQLFLASGVLTSRLGDMLGTIHLLFVSVLTASALSGMLRFNVRKLMLAFGFIVLLGAGATLGTRTYLASRLSTEYDKDEIIHNMHSAMHSAPAVVHQSVPPIRDESNASAMQRIADRGILRIGYHSDNLPASFFNAEGELVGYDIDMAQLLAQQTGCQLEFVPFTFATLAEQLNNGDFDIAMSSIGMLPTRLTQLAFSEPYLQATVAIITPDHRREELADRIALGDFNGYRFAVARSGDISRIAAPLLPGAEFVETSSLRDYCESGGDFADGMIWGAESGSAWTLLYPGFSVVPIRPLYQVPVGYAVSRGNGELAHFISQWLTVVEASPTNERLYDHWILGKNAQRQNPRWSIIRDVLHWVD